MNKRECLYEIADLKLDTVLHQMNDVELGKYWEKLHSFTEKYPAIEEDLKASLSENDYKLFFTQISALRDELAAIYAGNLAGEIQTQLNTYTSYDKIKHDRLVAFTDYFLSTVSMLSIDIQKAELDSSGNPVAEVAAKATEPEIPGRQKIILAVDDQAIHLYALKAHLSDFGYKLTCLTSAHEALRYLTKNTPDLFILDIMMPGMDGFELAQRIRESGQTGKIIFLSGSSSPDNVTNAVKAGCVDFITKPAVKEIVLNKISKHL